MKVKSMEQKKQNKRKRYVRTAIAVAVGVVIGALAMRFLSSPERWIRL